MVWSATPSSGRPVERWNRLTASVVRGPYRPSSGPGANPLSGEFALELLDALNASGERPVGGAGPQRGQRGGVSDAVGGEPADPLELADGVGGQRPVASVDEPGAKPQPGQLAL